MYMQYKCGCRTGSPFMWNHPNEQRPSMFMDDPMFRVSKSGRSLSQASTENVEKARANGSVAGYIKGISRNKEAEILRIRDFSLFSRARANKS